MNCLKFLSNSSYFNFLRLRAVSIYPSLYFGPQCIVDTAQKNIPTGFLQKHYSTSRIKCTQTNLFHQHSCLLQVQSPPFYDVYRLKSSKSKKTRRSNQDKDSDDETYDSDDSEDNWILERGHNFRDSKFRVTSVRLDLVASCGFKISRVEAEKAYYGGKLMVNGQRIKKKSAFVHEGDVLDLKRSASDTSSDDSSSIFRAILLKIGDYKPGSDKVWILMRIYTKPFSSIEEANKS